MKKLHTGTTVTKTGYCLVATRPAILNMRLTELPDAGTAKVSLVIFLNYGMMDDFPSTIREPI